MKFDLSKSTLYFVREFSKVARYFLLGVAILGISLTLRLLYVDLHPINDLMGKETHNCVKEDFPSVANGTGMVATAHSTTCDYFIAHGLETTFVYVHRSGERDSGQSLVFMFSNGGNLDPPRMIWSDDLTLHISVAEVREVAKQVASKNGVKISYSIDKEDMSREESRRIRMHNAQAEFIWLILWLAVCVLMVRSILRERKKDKLSNDPRPEN